MRNTITLLLLLCTASTALMAQTRFLDPMFEVSAPQTMVYGKNVDVFLEDVNELEVDYYEPVGDDSEARPVAVLFPTGNFLLQYLNRGPYGSRKDSAVVEIINRLVQRGYVGMSAEYRTGWLPQSMDQDTRTSTILQAAYRGGQDAHTLARYLRKTVVEDGNPMRIDTNRVVYIGLGTGGYVTYTHAYLDDVQEVLDEDRFYQVINGTPVPYVNEANFSNPQGTLPASFPASLGGGPSNIPNWVGYGSDVAMTVNIGGACGDIDWLSNDGNDPITLGYHSPSDPFAPFSQGNVVVPTTGDIVIDGVAGSEAVTERANELGLNDAIANANSPTLDDMFSTLSEVVNQRNAFYKTQTVDLSRLGQGENVDLSHDNMYPLGVGVTTPTGTVGSPFNWLDSAQVRLEVQGFNAATGQEISASDIIRNEALTNPNAYNAAGARLVIDTIMAHFYPRAFMGLDLDGLISSSDLITSEEATLQIMPNPATEFVAVETAPGQPILDWAIYDLNGRRVRQGFDVNNSRTIVTRGNLPRGAYVLRVRVDKGITAKKIIFE